MTPSPATTSPNALGAVATTDSGGGVLTYLLGHPSEVLAILLILILFGDGPRHRLVQFLRIGSLTLKSIADVLDGRQ